MPNGMCNGFLSKTGASVTGEEAARLLEKKQAEPSAEHLTAQAVTPVKRAIFDKAMREYTPKE